MKTPQNNPYSVNFDYLMFDDAVEYSIRQALDRINMDLDRKAYLAKIRIRRQINTMRVKLMHPSEIKIQKSDIAVGLERFRESLEHISR